MLEVSGDVSSYVQYYHEVLLVNKYVRFVQGSIENPEILALTTNAQQTR